MTDDYVDDTLEAVMNYIKIELGAKQVTLIWGNEKLNMRPLINAFFEQFGGVIVHYDLKEVMIAIEKYGYGYTMNELDHRTTIELVKFHREHPEQ